MNVPKLLLTVCLLTAIFLLTARAEEAPANAKKPLSMLPVNPAIMLEFPSIPALFSKGASTGIGRMFKVQGVWDLIEWARLQMATDPDLNYITVEKAVLSTFRLLTGQVCLAAYLPENDEPYVVMAFETNRSEEELHSEVASILQYFDIVVGNPKKYTAQELGIDNMPGFPGVDLYTINSGFHYYYAHGNLFIISSQNALKHMANVMAGGLSFDAAALEAELGYAHMKDSIFNTWFNVGTVAKRLPKEDDTRELQILGLDNITWFTSSCEIGSGLFNERLEIFYEGGPKGIWGAFTSGETLERNNLVPSHAFACLSQRVDYAALHDLVLELADTQGARGDVEDLLEEIRDVMKMDLGEVIRQCVDGDTTAYAMFPPNGFIPDYAVHVTLRDVAGAAAGLEAINKSIPEALRMSVWKENPLYWITPTDFMPFTAGFMVHKDNFVICNGPLGLKNMLFRKPDAPNITTVEVFNRLSARLPRKQGEHARAFVNIKPLGEKFMPLLSFIQAFDRTAENLIMPIWADFDPLFSGIYSRQYRDGEKIVTESTGDIPVIGVLSIAFPAGIMFMTSGEMMIDEVPIAVVQPTLQGSIDRLPKIYQLLDEYATGHDGEFPPSLDSVAKKDNLDIFQSPETMSPIDPNDVDGTSDYYFFKQLNKKDADIILLANRLPITRGLRVAMFCDGTVKTVTDEELLVLIAAYNQRAGMDIVLEDGFIF